MQTQKQATKAMLEAVTPEFMEEVVKKGFAGVSAEGGLVDRRSEVNRDAIPIQKNSKLGIPAPAEIQSPALPTPPADQTQAHPDAPSAPAAPVIDHADKSKDPQGGKAQSSPAAARTKKQLTRFRFEFEILDGRRNVVKRENVSADAETEAEAIDLAVASLNVPEGHTHRYTGQFSRRPVEA